MRDGASKLSLAAPAAPRRSSGTAAVPQSFNGGVQTYSYPAAEDSRDHARQTAQQSRFIAGKSFFLNGEQWIDSEIQKAPSSRKVRVQFNTPEYFDLLKKNAKVLAWLSQGRNVQFVLDGTIYEIHE